MSEWAYLNYLENFNMAAILRSGWAFEPEVVLEIESYIDIGHAIPYILSFWSPF